MTYKSLSKASQETIKRTTIKARAKKLESGEIKRFGVDGDPDQINYIIETMDLVKTSRMSHREALYIICKKFRKDRTNE